MSRLFAGAMVPHDGYGNCAIALGRELEKLGWDVEDLCGGTGDYPSVDRKITPETEGTAVVFGIPPLWGWVGAGRRIGWTMYETDRIPEEFVDDIIEYGDEILVPNEFCRRVFEDQIGHDGIHVVPLGVDVDQYKLQDRRNRDEKPYTFLWSGTPDRRKGWDVAYRAFLQAFRHRMDVRLVLHFRRFPIGVRGFMDCNVHAFQGDISDAVWLQTLQEADCLLYPSRGEGHGMVPREAAATGMPVICTQWGGLEDAHKWALPVPVRGLVQAEYGRWDRGTIGYWGDPDPDAVVAWMLWCYDKREQAATRGLSGAAYVREHYRWDRVAGGLHKLMEVRGW